MGYLQCDDGNFEDGDGCSSKCEIEKGWECFDGCRSAADTCVPIVPTGTMSECQAFASQFDNTCGVTTPCSFEEMDSKEVSCSNIDDSCPGDVEDDKCNFRRRLCVTCSEREGSRYIRVQTNSFPDHCISSKTKAHENQIDFEVYFNPRLRDPTPVSITTQAVLDSQVCTWNWPAHETPFGLTLYSGNVDGVVGITFTGVPIYGGSGEGTNKDAILPKPASAMSYLNQMDFCLGNVNSISQFYHFYTFSPCMMTSAQKSADPPQTCSGYGNCATNPKTYMISGVTKAKTLVGIALDGHLIYGPWKTATATWTKCDVDVCNGINMEDDEYAYAMTTFHPYTIGCWGPGNKQTIKQSCSTNPKWC